jgi:hypothetical protein
MSSDTVEFGGLVREAAMHLRAFLWVSLIGLFVANLKWLGSS